MSNANAVLIKGNLGFVTMTMTKRCSYESGGGKVPPVVLDKRAEI